MRTILIRLAELLLLCFTMSPISCALYYYRWVPNTEAAYGIMLIIITIIFMVSNVFMLRQCFFELRSTWRYYLLNYAAYGIFMLLTVIIYLLFGQIPYAWLFNTLKLMAFTDFDLSTADATAVTHGIMLLIIAVAPIGMDWVFDLPEEDFEDEEEEDFEDEEDPMEE